jgi:high affinity sulfate transporter 1
VNALSDERCPDRLDRWIPGIAILRDYKLAWLAKDALAGCVLTAILVPTGMGYAQAAGLPAINGLYATIVPLLAYAIFGPSRVLVLAPDSSLAALIAATILPLAAGNADRALSLAGMLAILSGTLCIVAGLSKLGFVTELLSKPIRYGYMNGIVLTVLIGQLPTILGFSVSGEDVLQRAVALLSGILEGRTNWMATAIGLSCLVVILACKRWATRFPGVLIAVVGATVIVWLSDLDKRSNLSVIGPLPQGLPGFDTPIVSVSDLRTLFSGAVAIALVSFADMSVLSRTYAQRGGYKVDANQEFIALGVANLATGLFQGFPVSSSASRTPVAESAGAKTQIAGIVGASCIAALLIFAPTLLNKLPHAALAAVVISACIGLMEISGVLRVYRLRPSELAFSIVCFLGVILFGAIEGIFIAVALALLAFIWRAWRPYDAVLGRVDGLKGYHDISRHPEAKQIPGLVLFRWDAPLFFANAAVFQEHVLQAVADAPTPTKWIVVAAEPVTDIDITAADMLSELDQQLHQSGIELCFAEMKGPVKDRLKRYGLFTAFGTESFFPTIGRAVDEFVAKHHVEWQDWEDQS